MSSLCPEASGKRKINSEGGASSEPQDAPQLGRPRTRKSLQSVGTNGTMPNYNPAKAASAASKVEHAQGGLRQQPGVGVQPQSLVPRPQKQVCARAAIPPLGLGGSIPQYPLLGPAPRPHQRNCARAQTLGPRLGRGRRPWGCTSVPAAPRCFGQRVRRGAPR